MTSICTYYISSELVWLQSFQCSTIKKKSFLCSYYPFESVSIEEFIKLMHVGITIYIIYKTISKFNPRFHWNVGALKVTFGRRRPTWNLRNEQRLKNLLWCSVKMDNMHWCIWKQSMVLRFHSIKKSKYPQGKWKYWMSVYKIFQIVCLPKMFFAFATHHSAHKSGNRLGPVPEKS